MSSARVFARTGERSPSARRRGNGARRLAAVILLAIVFGCTSGVAPGPYDSPGERRQGMDPG